MAQVALDTPLFEVLGAKSAFLRRLENLGLATIRDLLWHFPSRYEDFSKIYSIAELEPGQQATIQGVVEEVHLRRSFRRQMNIVEATIADDTGSIRAIWFNQPYVANSLKVGRNANFSGKVALSEESEMYLNHPAYEVMRSEYTADTYEETKHTARLVPVYPETRGLTSRGIRFVMQAVLKRVHGLKEWIPKATLGGFDFPELNEAIQTIHFPRTLEDAMAARKRFSFENLFLLQLTNLQQKLKLAEKKAPVIKTDLEKVRSILTKLPFELTPSQKKSLWEIVKDLERPQPMNRLLQGDVGSGKTVVAAIAATAVAANGYQTAFMAPTEILARQHFETMKKLLLTIPAEEQPLIGLVTGSGATVFYENDVSAELSKPAVEKKVASGEVAILFGTHALIQKTIAFKELGLVIVDEQHRFGVRQRAELMSKKNGIMPHFFSMSATPIPQRSCLRCLAILIFLLSRNFPLGENRSKPKSYLLSNASQHINLLNNRFKKGDKYL
jgi:ATP-dependent DNA helicase RecG